MARFRPHHPWCSRLILISAICAAGLASPHEASADEESATGWPCQLQLIVTAELRAFVDEAWERSATFREQCRKLATARPVVTVHVASSQELYRADTRMRVFEDGTMLARVRVRPTSAVVELIAHELEHVLERLDGVNLLMESRRSGSGVTVSGGAFETRRAADAGRRVAREVRDASRARR
jgi:hypothetical protein